MSADRQRTGMVASLRRRLRESDDAGATTIEWVIITAVLVIAVSVVGAIVLNVVRERAAEMERCSSTAASGQNC